MKFSKVRLADPKGLELEWRNVSQSVFQLGIEQGWRLESSELGVIATHDSRALPLLLPWSQVSSCDILTVADSFTVPLGEVAKRPVGRPRLNP